MKKIFFYAFALLGFGAALFSCAKEKNADLKYETQNLVIPSASPDYAVARMPASLNFTNTKKAVVVNNDKAFLGRVLFYDKKLSLNNAVSCGSCHHQANGFADNVALSTGFNGAKTSRNSMAICNTTFTKGFFWDKRAMNIEDLVLQPVRNHIEMGIESTTSLVSKLGKVDYYPQLFTRAFGASDITKEKITEAMSSFLTSMVASNSKFDDGKNQSFKNFTPLESQGMTLFQKSCGSCHSGSSFNSNTWDEGSSESANIGLDGNYSDPGMGAFADNGTVDNLTGVPNGFGGGAILANGVFKVPSLRNIGLTAPYMHDGRFKTLENVIEHYNSGIQDHPALDWRLQDNGLTSGGNPTLKAKRFNWTDTEKAAIIAFLKTLTDTKMTSDPKFANPFQ